MALEGGKKKISRIKDLFGIPRKERILASKLKSGVLY